VRQERLKKEMEEPLGFDLKIQTGRSAVGIDFSGFETFLRWAWWQLKYFWNFHPEPWGR